MTEWKYFRQQRQKLMKRSELFKWMPVCACREKYESVIKGWTAECIFRAGSEDVLVSTLTGLQRVERSYMCANMNNEKLKMMLRKKKKIDIRTEMKRCEWAEDGSQRTGRKWNEDAGWRLKRDFPVGYPVPTTCEICSEHPVAFNHQSSEATRKLMPKCRGRNGERENEK